MPKISDLVQRSRDGGKSLRGLAQMTDGVVSHNRFDDWSKDNVKEFPEPKTLRAATKALDEDITVIVLAFAASIGLEVRTDGPMLAGSIPPGMEGLPVEAQRAWLSVGREMVRLHQEQGEPVADVTPIRPPELRPAARKRTGPRERDQLE